MKIDHAGRSPWYMFSALLMVMLMAFSSVPGSAEGTEVLLDHFEYGNENATLSFKGMNETEPTDLFISIPRGAAIIEANVSVRGIEGPSLGYTTMDYNNHAVDSDLWAIHEEDTGIYEPSLDPFNNTWDSMPSSQVANVKKVDGNYWHTQTPSTPTTAPWEYPIQMFHFRPDVDNATEHEIQWKGHGKCLGNNTPVKYHAEMWIYDHDIEEWYSGCSYWWFDANDTWLNYTIYPFDNFMSDNGSVDVAIVGNSAEVNNSVQPPVSDHGHLYTDYIGLATEHNSTVLEHPEDVTLTVFNRYMRVADGPLNDTVLYDDTALADAIQAQIDSYPQQPGNVTVPIGVAIARRTQAQVEVFDLNILYNSTGVIPNDPPEWTGPTSVDVKEDAPWKPVIDLDQAFTDDHDEGDLQFTIAEVSHDGALDTRIRQGLLDHNYLEVKPLDHYYGDVEVIVAAADSGGLRTQSSPITVHIEPVPDAPWLLEPGVVSINESERLELTLVVLDPDMPEDSFTFSDTSDDFDIDPTTGTIDWTPTYDDVGLHTSMVSVQDSYGLTDRITLVIDVMDVNHAPVITSATSVDALEGQTVEYWITAEDEDAPQGDTLTYSAWSMDVDVTMDALTGRVTFATDKGFIGDVLVFVKVGDSFGVETSASVSFAIGNINDPPTMEAIGHLTYDEGDTVSVHLLIDDPDLPLALEEPEVLSITSDGPSFLQADDLGYVNITVDQSMLGEHVVTYTVTDRGGLSASIEVLWSLLNVNEDPVIGTEVPAQATAVEDQLFTLDLEATDGDGDTLTWSDSSPLFDIDPATGVITFTPSQAQVGTHHVTVSVGDGNEGLATVTFDLVVENVNDAPVIVSVQPSDGAQFKEGELVRLLVEATDEDGDTLTYTWMEGDTELGAGSPLSLKDLSPGIHTIKLVVTDGTEDAERAFDIYIEAVDDDGDGGGIPLTVLLGLVMGIISAIALFYLLMEKRKGPETPLM